MLGRMPFEQVGLMIVRVWAEPESSVPLRAVLRSTTDISSGLQLQLTLSVIEDVCEAVRSWLTEIVRSVSGSEDNEPV